MSYGLIIPKGSLNGRMELRLQTAQRAKSHKVAHKLRLKRIPAQAAKFVAWRNKAGI